MLPILRHLAAAALLALPLIPTSYASDGEFILENLSFGQKSEISSNKRSVPGWQLNGEGYIPEVSRDRLVLTPQNVGDRRSWIWSDNPLQSVEWTAELEFLAIGDPARGSGMLQVWLTKEKPAGQMTSIYTVEKFDGLALVIDQHGGTNGKVRGFLNDGTVNYRKYKSVDSLAFGHCAFPYRNLGHYSSLKIKQSARDFEILIGGQSCFKSDNVVLPAGYRFGVTAVSNEHAESFELHKFVVTTPSPSSANDPSHPIKHQQSPLVQPAAQVQQQPLGAGAFGGTPVGNAPASDTQVIEMLNRLQATVSNVDNIWQELKGVESRSLERHNELVKTVKASTDQMTNLIRRMDQLDSAVKRVQNDIEGRDYQQHLTNLQQALKDTQSNILHSLPQSMSHIVSSSAPRMGFFVFVLIAFQVILVGCYVVYKKRRSNSPKKLL